VWPGCKYFVFDLRATKPGTEKTKKIEKKANGSEEKLNGPGTIAGGFHPGPA